MKWSSGDTWSCRVPLPAGSTLECKYVVVDETGTAVRWQEGTNMSIRVPAAFEGQALQDFEVAMSWCKTYSAFSAQPLTSPAAALAAATAPAVAAWAMAKGASPAPSRAVSPAPAAGAFAGASGSSVPPTFSQPAKPAAVSTLPPSVVSAALPPGAKPNGMAAEVALAAASAILQPSTPTPSSASGAGRTAAAAAFSSELTPGTEDSPGGMSMTLPPRSSSPPFKLSLSSNLAQLMELPSTLSRSGSGGNLAASASASASASAVSPAAPSTPTALAPAPVRAASPVKAAAAVAPSSFPIDLPASAASSRAASPAPSRPVVEPMPASASSSVSSYGRQAPSPSHYDAASGYGSSEYDMWASAYGMPYMHTPFDLDAYAEVDQTAPEPTPAASLRSPSPKAVAPPVPGTDLLESAMQAARGPSPRASEPASVAASKAAAPSIFANPAPAAATAAGAQSIFSAAPKAASPKPSASKPAAAPAPAPAPAATPTFASASASASAAPAAAASAPASPGLPSYRSVSCSSPAVSRWADQTLFELSASSIASDEDSDEEAAAETESLVAHALEAPVTAEDMSVLLKQLGGALGRSVRMRHEGKDSAATDLLELDRQIALASSRLYRKRDNLLVGFVKTETRRQLAAATAAVAPSRAPSSQRTPV
ncbi:hypothetical protein HYH03_013754 [Edaphochlamys debaryana]|uniref:CBM20 domain-containing protein n=1 Tax=Edaphochlamys debaryana TaxID=47281 RepID=A0A836BSU3_9CHLO|nr:hypothetical protein HYH03_013754 [Edaphochlamys debaryana]|eukprot:KAG2487615.1 hypothetical protein HYH03_013754 [Edaphochlamys debaryana]